MTTERWKVVNIQERLEITPGEGPRTLIVVRFSTPAGYVGTVELPQTEATKEKLREIIEAKVKDIEGILTLKG